MRATRSVFLIPAVVFVLSLFACFEPEENSNKHRQTPDPLDSLLGYYDGTVVRTLCKQRESNSCVVMETDTIPAGGPSLTWYGSTLLFFLSGIGSITVQLGDTVFSGPADTIGAVSCFRIPDQTSMFIADSSWIAGEILYEHAEGGEICRSASGDMTHFTLQPKSDPHLRDAPRRTFRLHRVPNP